MGTWDEKEYKRAAQAVKGQLVQIREGKLPSKGDYGHYIVYEIKDQTWIEIPDQILPDVIAGFDDVVKEVKSPVIGYSFLVSAFIRVA